MVMETLWKYEWDSGSSGLRMVSNPDEETWESRSVGGKM